MEYKRLEIYVWWTCNQKCTYCMEFSTMEESWSVKVSKYEILKKLIKFKKQWYNHVTYLWWEPFIQPVFYDALKLWKKLWYTILVTTNCTTLHLDNQASKYLPYIDELILSLEWITKEQQQKISRTKNYVYWDEVFRNIKKYWSWKMLKTNIVITKDNLDYLFDLVKFSYDNNVKNIAVTYPDIDLNYYWKKHILKYVMPSYTECIDVIMSIIDYSNEKWINLKLPDFPFCIFPRDRIEEYIKLTDDYDFQTRIKVTSKNDIIDRWSLFSPKITPRERQHIGECKKCVYKNNCWWPSKYYKKFYWSSIIKAIKK